MPESPLHDPLLRWYDTHRRDLPWRRPDVDGWAVLVSEVMLQQTPVARVLPAYEAWMRRWPAPAALAVEPAGEAVRMWGRLGYPRRALRLHAAATVIDQSFDGIVPADYDDLRSLPGIGDYTAAAVSAFAYRRRTLVLDTNVRRVLGRALGGVQFPSTAISKAEREQALSVLPDEADLAAQWSVAAMELGALVCTAERPACAGCPVSDLCRWKACGYPDYGGPPRKAQTYAGTDRQCRGRILGVLRDAERAVTAADVESAWDDSEQRERALASLIEDGLVVRTADGRLSLPG